MFGRVSTRMFINGNALAWQQESYFDRRPRSCPVTDKTKNELTKGLLQPSVLDPSSRDLCSSITSTASVMLPESPPLECSAIVDLTHQNRTQPSSLGFLNKCNSTYRIEQFLCSFHGPMESELNIINRVGLASCHCSQVIHTSIARPIEHHNLPIHHYRLLDESYKTCHWKHR